MLAVTDWFAVLFLCLLPIFVWILHIAFLFVRADYDKLSYRKEPKVLLLLQSICNCVLGEFWHFYNSQLSSLVMLLSIVVVGVFFLSLWLQQRFRERRNSVLRGLLSNALLELFTRVQQKQITQGIRGVACIVLQFTYNSVTHAIIRGRAKLPNCFFRTVLNNTFSKAWLNIRAFN